MVRLAVFCLCWRLIAGGLIDAQVKKLPSESSLPGQPEKVVVTPPDSPPPPPPKRELPSESDLPAGFRRPLVIEEPAKTATPPKKTEQPPEPKTPQSAPRQVNLDLPNESALPQVVDNTQPPPKRGDAAQQDQQRLGQKPAGLPWLRLDQRGHMATVRSVCFTGDGGRLCSAGLDKELYIWSRVNLGRTPQWAYQRTVRWPIQRAIRGRVYAVDSHKDLVAMAGHGAFGELGAINLIDATSGQLVKVLVDEDKGHRQPVLDLQFGSDGQTLVSIDREGHVILWRRNPESGAWENESIHQPDSQRYAAAAAERLKVIRGRAAVAMTTRYIIAAVYTGTPSQGRRRGESHWQLERYDLRSKTSRRFGMDHYGMVTALAVSSNGRYLASADSRGSLFVWDLVNNRLVKRIGNRVARSLVYTSLAFRPGRNEFVAGSARSRTYQTSVSWWNVDSGERPRRQVNVSNTIYDLRYSADGRWLAYANGTAVYVRPADPGAVQPIVLRSTVLPPTKVTFSRESGSYRLAFSTRSDLALNGVFNPGTSELENKRLRASDWRGASQGQGWSFRTEGRAPNIEVSLYFNNRKAAKLPTVPSFQGIPRHSCWINDANGRPYALAVDGTGQNMIHVYRLVRQGVAPLLRQFRGHSAAITSIAVSGDRRYLASSSLDGTIRYWKLDDFDKAGSLINRWGAAFEIQNNQLLVSAIREAGPAYFRGLRVGDRIVELAWDNERRQPVVTRTAAEMLDTLNRVPAETLLTFHYERGRVRQEGFQILPAWQQLASLHVAANRQWAFWAPTGYYDASFDGHKLFGWQFNRGRSRAPEYFVAAQLRKALERPAVMKQLLKAGSIEAAFRTADLQPPLDAANLLVDKFRLRPTIEILAPAADDRVQGGYVKLRARISFRGGQTLVPPKAFASGVVAGNRQVVGSEEVPGGQAITYEWDARLPADEKVMLQVVASTDAEVANVGSRMIAQQLSTTPRRSRLFVLSAGVNEYQDAQIGKLDFAVNNATQVVDTLRRTGGGLYDQQALTLLNRNATPGLWSMASEQFAERLAEQVSPNDLLVIFLSGHGVRDPRTGKYYFITANANYQDIRAGRFQNCLEFSDLARFGRIPCRKLVILDTCHSGAVQPLEQQNLKAAVRALQDDMVFTLTASEGSQEAAESRDRKLGLFTYRLLDGLNGSADREGDGDGIVTFREVATYVQQSVRSDSLNSSVRQYPTAGPAELLDLARIPLARVPRRGSPRP